jgi:hypothetical protein
MEIRLQEMLQTTARANNIPDKNGWPLLERYMEWFMLNCGSTFDTATALFKINVREDGTPDYTGYNAPSLIDWIIDLFYPRAERPARIFLRYQFVYDRLDTIACKPGFWQFLSELYTTTDYATRFILAVRGKLPTEFIGKPGRRTGHDNKTLCNESFDRLLDLGVIPCLSG